jgi:hypothetical protein
MATYVPGSETYLPDIKPFTPDYKFLSAVLDVRQDKYDTNWQATNDVYNKVVFADLSRGDTNEQREQYVNKLAPSLEKIAGMDLSLAQNAQSAKAVFAPFFEDKLIVKDMVKTSNYKKEMSHAQRLLSSPDLDVSGKYWLDGVKELQYRMDDFINMSPDDALNAPTYKYTPKQNLFKLSEELLGGMKPPLKIKIDRLSKDGNWIITQQNGEQVVGPALQIIQERLGKNAKVQASYQTKSYVASRDFASKGMEAGHFTTVKEGQNAWAEQTIGAIEANNSKEIKEGITKLNEQEIVNVRWENYKKINGVIPDSEDDKLMKKQSSAYEATKLAMNNQRDIKEIIDTPSNGLETTLNRAYQLLMKTNMQSDMLKAAQNYSMRDMEATLDVNPYKKQQIQFRMDMTKLSTNARYRSDLQKQKAFDDKALLKLKGIGANSKLLDILTESKTTMGDSNTTGFETTEDGKVNPNSDVIDGSFKGFQKANATLDGLSVHNITEGLRLLKPNGDIVDGKATNMWTIKTANGDITGNLKKINYELNKKVEGTNQYVNADVIRELHTQNYNLLTARDENGTFKLKGTHPELMSNPDFQTLAQNIHSQDRDRNTINMIYGEALDTYSEAAVITEKYAREQSTSDGQNLDNMMNQGMPGIMKTLPSGSKVKLTQQEYIDLAIAKAASGELTNYDNAGVDAGTHNKDYMDWHDVPNGEPYQVKTFDGLVTKYPTKEVMGLDKAAITDDAKRAYKTLSETLNGGLTQTLSKGAPGVPTASFEGLLQGRSGSYEDLAVGVTYQGSFDPKIAEGQGVVIVGEYAKQLAALDAKGIKPLVFAGEEELGIENSLSGEQDPNGAISQFMSNTMQDIRSRLGNPKSSNSLNASPRGVWTYSPVYGSAEDGDKTMAAYSYTATESYIDSKLDKKAAGYKELKAKLMKGVTIMFDQKWDNNPRSTSQNFGNAIVANIMSSPDAVYTEYKNNTQGDGIGNYSFSQISEDRYISNYEYRQYQPGGTYTTERGSRVIPIENGNFSVLDKQKAFVEELFSQAKLKSDEAKKKDNAINGKK